MDAFWLALRIALFFCLFTGYCLWLNRLINAEPLFVPVLAASALGCAVLLGGILNVIPAVLAAFCALGCYGLAWEAAKGKRFRAFFAHPGLILFAAACVYTLFYFQNVYLEGAQDDLNHWAPAVRVLLRYDRLPRHTDAIINFTSYPTGSAGLIYVFCRIAGTTAGGMMLAAQEMLLLSAALPLFAFVKRDRPAGYAVALLCLLAGASGRMASGIDALMVDKLLGALAGAGFVIAAYYRGEMGKRWPLVALMGCYLTIVKSSGIFFALVLAVQAAFYLRRYGSLTRKGRLVRAAFLAGTPAALLLLWNRHADLVFDGGMMSRHSLSLRYLLRTVTNKDAGENLQTVKDFFDQFTDPAVMRDTLIVCGLLLCALLLCRLFKIKTDLPGGRLAGFGAGVYAAYILGLVGMYLFSMPEGVVGSFPRYEGTARLLLLVMTGTYLVDLTNHCDLRLRGGALGATCALLLTLAAAWPLCPDAPALAVRQKRGSEYIESFLALAPDRGKEARYAVYVSDAYRYYGYEAAVASYYLYPAAGTLVSNAELWELDDWTENYDYLVIWKADQAYEAYAKERGIDPARRTWTAEEYQAALSEGSGN